MRIDVHLHLDEGLLRLILNELGTLTRNQETIMSLLDDIKAKQDTAIALAQQDTDLDTSILGVVTADAQMIVDLKAALAAAGTDPVKLQGVSDAMDGIIATQQAAIKRKSDAITANTPAA